MLHIHFTGDDLARVRISSDWGPLPEVLFSLGALSRRAPAVLLEGWRSKMRTNPQYRGRPVTALVQPFAKVDLITVAGRAASIEEAMEGLLAANRGHLRVELDHLGPRLGEAEPGARSWMQALYGGNPEARQHLVTLLQEYYRRAVGPYWEQMHSHLDVDRAMRGRLMTEGGVERLLTTLHHTIRWRPPVLEVMRPPSRKVTPIHLDGRSLTLVPSIFCSPYPMLFYSTDDDTSPVVLFYPALQEADSATAIWAPGLARRPALEALLGRTRAIALEVTTDPRTTTELAQRLGVAASTASHHASVLRGAGLIDSHRYGSAVLHRITSKGRQLLEGRPQAPSNDSNATQSSSEGS